MGAILNSVCPVVEQSAAWEPLPDLKVYFNLKTERFTMHLCLWALFTFMLVFTLMNTFQLFWKKYREMEEENQFYWCHYTTNVVFTVTVGPFALLAILKDNYISSDILHNSTFFSMFLLSVGIGYIVYDIIVQVILYAFTKDCNLTCLFFDITNGIVFIQMICYSYGHFLGCVLLLLHCTLGFDGLAYMSEQFEFEYRKKYREFVSTFYQPSIYLNIYSPLVGGYCLVVTFQQWSIISQNICPLLIFIYALVLIEKFVKPMIYARVNIEKFVKALYREKNQSSFFWVPRD